MSKVERRAVEQSVVDEAFGRLSLRQRRLMLWHKVDGLSYDEMAARLGVSRDALTREMAELIFDWCAAVEEVEAALP